MSFHRVAGRLFQSERERRRSGAERVDPEDGDGRDGERASILTVLEGETDQHEDNLGDVA